jgi:hypothetical protein
MTSETSPRPVSPLRARMIEDMTMRGFKEDTRRDYVRELAEIDDLSLEELMARGSAPYHVFAKLDRKMDQILGEPACKKVTAHPVVFSNVITKWAKHTNAGPKGAGDMSYKTDRFVEWFGHDDMVRVTLPEYPRIPRCKDRGDRRHL